METKEICRKLNQFVDEVSLGYKGTIDLSLLCEAANRLEELEKQNEAMMKELCDKEDLVREAEGRFYELEKELDTLKNASKISSKITNNGDVLSMAYDYEKKPETEWISVEDERKPKHLHNYFIAYVFGVCDEHFFGEAVYIADKGNGIVDGAHFNDEGVDGMRVTHWMEIPKLPEPPKPKEPTFKDVFLEKFPKATVDKNGIPFVCLQHIFGGLGCNEDNSCCPYCWNQPYFEEEKE